MHTHYVVFTVQRWYILSFDQKRMLTPDITPNEVPLAHTK